MSAIFPPDERQTLVNHTRRIRALEATPFQDGAWTAVDLGDFTNGWTVGVNSEDQPSYIVTGNRWLGLRGRIFSGSDGLSAFTLPVAPLKAHTFGADVSTGDSVLGAAGAGGNHGAVTIDASGNVIPYITPPGFIGPVPYLLPFGNAGLDTFAYWINGGTNIYQGFTNALGVKLASTPAVRGALFTGGQQHSDAELEATISAATEVYLGLRCQLPYTPGSQDFPAGYWLICSATGGTAIQVRIYDLFGASVDYASGQTSPGFATGDVITWRINYSTVTALKNGVALAEINPGADMSHPWTSGFVGIGAGGTHGVSLVSQAAGRLPTNVGVSLTEVWVKLDG